MRTQGRRACGAILAILSAAVLAVGARHAGVSRAAQDHRFYYPERGNAWERRAPEAVGMDGERLRDAIAFSQDPAHAGWPEDLNAALLEYNGGKRHDDGRLRGPTKPHGPVTGVIVRHGYLVAEWGDPKRVDMTFSASKSFVSTIAGLAYDRGLIRSVHDRVAEYVQDGGFDSPHNAKITWDMLLRQTSEWDGTLWGKHPAAHSPRDELRELQEPGTYYEYNDVRVNRLALALLRIWRKPLPEVLREEVMDPIGASRMWEWHGYDNSWVTIDGLQVQSVSGGGHWGGGMWISARDLARFGYLTLRNGRWKDRQVLSEEWIRLAKTPGALRPNYGFMNWGPNTGRRAIPSAPETAFTHSGAGINRVYVDSEHDLVVVIRWIDGEYFDGFIQRILAAVAAE